MSSLSSGTDVEVVDVVDVVDDEVVVVDVVDVVDVVEVEVVEEAAVPGSGDSTVDVEASGNCAEVVGPNRSSA